MSVVGINDPKMREMLKELHQLVHLVQEERLRGEHTLQNISKTHDRMQQEVKVSPYYKTKLRGLYNTALSDAQAESVILKQALEKISEINAYKTKGVVEPKAPAMRRGVLMSLLQKEAASLPVWEASSKERPPSLCGCIQADSKYVVPKGKAVAAKVQGSEGEDNWILAEVVSYNSTSSKYDVEDIDSEQGKERHTLSKKNILALPLYKADPLSHPECLYAKDTVVMALYPQTTCFYKGMIQEPPKNADDGYLVLFEDTSYPDGYSPPLKVAQRYIVPCDDR